ncbi:MAG: hypothetical protein IPL99_12130 [Candidatus Competibacteraceae bacterium]|nr:hypothetical protein [Candidatus Competibacteraceae bacterium]
MNPCPTGKQSYPSPTATWRVIHFLTRKSALKTHKHNGTSRGNAYRCAECGQWHMTTHRRREPLKARPWQWQEEVR